MRQIQSNLKIPFTKQTACGSKTKTREQNFQADAKKDLLKF